MFSRNQSFVWKIENFDELQLLQSSIFFAETLNTFLTHHCLQKDVRDVFLFYLDIELYAKIKKDLVSKHLFLYIFINKSRFRQNIKKPEHPFLDIVKNETCAIFQQKILNFVAVGAHQSFQFFRQTACFLGNNTALSKLRYRVLYNLISITRL